MTRVPALEQQYANLIRKIMTQGCEKSSRNAPTLALFGETLTFNGLTKGLFPVLSGRKLYPKGVLGEFAAFLKGPKHVDDFTAEGCNYWGQWADENGNLSLDYGNAWRDFNGVDQLDEVILKLKHNPDDRRLLISGWRPERIAELSLPCCHMLYQWFVNHNTNTLEMMWYQRSVDVMVGMPSNFILAAIWNVLLAKEVGLFPGTIKWVFGDTHIYRDHISGAAQYNYQLDGVRGMPRYHLDAKSNIHNFKAEDLTITGYQPQQPIKFKVFK